MRPVFHLDLSGEASENTVIIVLLKDHEYFEYSVSSILLSQKYERRGNMFAYFKGSLADSFKKECFGLNKCSPDLSVLWLRDLSNL